MPYGKDETIRIPFDKAIIRTYINLAYTVECVQGQGQCSIHSCRSRYAEPLPCFAEERHYISGPCSPHTHTALDHGLGSTHCSGNCA